MTILEQAIRQVTAVSASAIAQARREIDMKTKPRGSLGRLEELAIQLAGIRGEKSFSTTRKCVVIMAADHGVTVEGVSAYPQVVTGQMLGNFAKGGAAINVIARQMGALVRVIDMGVANPAQELSGIEDWSVGRGTGNVAKEPAMKREQAMAAVENGMRIAIESCDKEVDVLAVGEMGIGNTTVSSALAAHYLDLPGQSVTGRGTGIVESDLAYKIQIVDAIVRRCRESGASNPIDVLTEIGGFEIAGLVGFMIGAARRRVPVVLDGFITGVAALVGTKLCPRLLRYLIASHCSQEPGHRIVLENLGLAPLFDLHLRLGEGTGAALAFPLIDAARNVLHEMATFESAGVSDSGA